MEGFHTEEQAALQAAQQHQQQQHVQQVQQVQQVTQPAQTQQIVLPAQQQQQQGEGAYDVTNGHLFESALHKSHAATPELFTPAAIVRTAEMQWLVLLFSLVCQCWQAQM